MGCFINLKDIEYGDLTVVERVKSSNRKRGAFWLCTCKCGNRIIIRGDNLRSGNRTHCGCKNIPSMHSHGMYKSSEYTVWDSMLQRCRNKNSAAYHYYGGRGIKVCERWTKFENFFADIGKRPSLDYTLERVDNDGNYEPDNCIWATRNEQARNKCNNRTFLVDGKILCATDLAREYKISLATIRYMMNEHKSNEEIIERCKKNIN